ncbi:MAG: TIGR00153 family protein [Pseudomonadota bacterium]
MASPTIASLFGRSPIKPIQTHMETVCECVALLSEFLANVIAEDWDKANQCGKQVVRLEKDADKKKLSIRKHLPNGLFLPVNRGDLLELLSTQDRLANRTRDITGLVWGRKMTIPASMQEKMTDYVGTAAQSSRYALQAIEELDELLSTGFSGLELKRVAEILDKLDKAEHNNDKQQIKLRAALFKLESELPPVDVMFLYQIIDKIGGLADTAQQVGSRLRLLMAK